MPRKRIFIAGHKGMVGSAVTRALENRAEYEIIKRSKSELNLFDPIAVEKFFAEEKPEYVILAAAKVGGIWINSIKPVDFLLENLKIQNNVIEFSHKHGVKKLVFLGSSCIYPRECPQPIKEEYLPTSPLEPTNEAYSLAKIAGIRLCQAYNKQFGDNFISAMPTNLYGPGDNFDLETSHVLPALIRKFHDAKTQGKDAVTLWGSGRPRREFLYVDDMADAIVFLLENYNDTEHINVGYGEDIAIADLAELMRDVIGFRGRIVWDSARPDGMMRKLIDSSKLRRLGWSPRVTLAQGIPLAYEAFLKTHSPD